MTFNREQISKRFNKAISEYDLETNILGYPEGTEITIQSVDKVERKNNFIHLDEIVYPDYTYATLPSANRPGDRDREK